MGGTRSDGHLQHHVVLGIRQKRPLEKVNPLLVGDLGDPADDRIHCGSRNGNADIGSGGNIILFGEQWNREGHLEITPVRRQKDLMAGTRGGAKCGDEDIGIDHGSNHVEL